MRATLRSIQRDECRIRALDESEQAAFPSLSPLQRYFPALSLFPSASLASSASSASMELPSKLYVHQWMEPDSSRRNQWKVQLSDGSHANVYVKTVHLLNPIDILKQCYVMPSHPWMPQIGSAWKDTVSKLHSRHNQAYVDAVANYVISRFRESNVTPHAVLSYGSYTGISSEYTYTISSEYDTYRQKSWFWKGMQAHGARMTLRHEESVALHPEYEAFRRDIMTCPIDLSTPYSEEEIELPTTLLEESSSEIHAVDAVAMEFDALSFSSETDDNHADEEDADDVDADDVDADEEDALAERIEIELVLPNVPVMAILQEAQEGVLDDLLDEEELDGCRHGTQAWEARWMAWLFQVVATLSFLQRSIQFTHNDLHSNNIVWRSTTERFLYYRDRRSGCVWRVPTFGKIFSLIDFGRAIFRVGRTQWISDDHLPDQDAGGQYNFGSFYDASMPKVVPNPSFDLCRLAVSMIDGLFGDDRPTKRRGKHVPVMSEEGSWIVYETRSSLYNLLWSWMVDDAGRTVYETEDGEEKYNGFELYIRIAHDVHSAIPHEQLHRTCFHPFLWKERIPSEITVYDI